MNQNIVNLFTSIINTVEFVYIMYKDFEKGLPICFSSPPSNTYMFDGWIPALLLLIPWHTRNSSRKTLCTEQWKGWNQISLGVRPGNTFFLLVRSTDGKHWLLWPWCSGQRCPLSGDTGDPRVLGLFSPSWVQFRLSVVSNSLRPHGLQHARPPCPSPTPKAYPYSCPLSRWCHPTVSSSVIPFSRLQPFPASGSF